MSRPLYALLMAAKWAKTPQLVKFARDLIKRGYTLIGSGGTVKYLGEAGVSAIDLSQYVGGGPLFGDRVKSLSREISAMLISDLRSEADATELSGLNLPVIDLTYVTFYDLEKEIAKDDCTRESVIKETDVGGPNANRAAAKGRRVVICDPVDIEPTLAWLDAGRPEEETYLDYLAAKAEFIVANYCLVSAEYTSDGEFDGFTGYRVANCVYGENPWQTSHGLFRSKQSDLDPLAIPNFKLIAGAPPSFINWTDVDRLTQTITHAAAGFERNCGAVPSLGFGVKHGNCCGGAFGSDQKVVVQNVVEGDHDALFGGFVMFNFPITEELAEIILTYGMNEGRRVLDGIIAPSFDAAAIELLKRKKDKCRFLVNPALANLGEASLDQVPRRRPVRGGFLKQDNYTFVLDFKDPRLAKYGELGSVEQRSLILAWAIGCTSNSNTITLVKNGQLIGNGVGQQARHYAAGLAKERTRTGHHQTDGQTRGAVAYSDSFFPFPDGAEILISLGIYGLLTSSGSLHDALTQKACANARVVLWMIPDKVGRGFFGH